jgi:hypothetical protein
VANDILTAAQLNTHLRDNMLETAPAKATTASGYFVTTGTNAIAQRVPAKSFIATAETTTSTAYVDLATAGPSVTVTTGTRALIFHRCRMENSTANVGSFQSWAISGATVRSAASRTACTIDGIAAANFVQIGDVDMLTDLTAGSNTFACKYQVGAGTGTFSNRFIAVMPL